MGRFLLGEAGFLRWRSCHPTGLFLGGSRHLGPGHFYGLRGNPARGGAGGPRQGLPHQCALVQAELGPAPLCRRRVQGGAGAGMAHRWQRLAVNEVGNPTILATLTVIAALLPAAFVSGMVGQYLRPLPIGASIAMLYSLVVALTVTPYLAYRMLRGKHLARTDTLGGKPTWGTLLGAWYQKGVGSFLDRPKRRWLLYAGVVLALTAAMGLVAVGGAHVKLLPNTDVDEMAVIIGALVKAKTNILISGGTGSGKTTLLNILSSYIPENERIITIEDAAELRLMQPHVVRLETRPPNMEGMGEIDARALVKNTLRMRPDRIIIGECRGGEIIDMLQAMNTGHEGSLTTIHANTARDALVRLENMVGLAGYNVQQKALRQQVVAAISVVIQTSRLSDGRRKIVSIQELTGMEGDMITMQEIFKFEQTAVAPDGTVLGRFRATGIRPRFADRLQSRGVPLADYLFDPNKLQDR